MLADLHYSSDSRAQGAANRKSMNLDGTMSRTGTSRSLTAGVALLCLTLGGCSTTGIAGLIDTHSATPVVVENNLNADTQTSSQPKKTATAERKPEIDKFTVASTKKVTSASQADTHKSAHCRYLEAEAGAEAAILASPTLGASSDDEGSYSVSLGMNLLDFRKAELVRESSSEKCRQNQSLKRIEKSLKLVNESVAYAAAQAKHDYLARHMKDLASVAAATNTQVSSGQMTAPQGAAIKQQITSMKADMAAAKSDADKRRNMPTLDQHQVTRQGSQLRRAEDRLQRINEEMRTLDAFKVNVEAGYRNVEGDALLTSNSISDDLYAKVNLGVRLGALSQQRRDYEQLAAQARAEALDEEAQGILWASNYGAKATRDALIGLRQSERELTRMMSEAKRNRNLMNSSDRAELVGPRLSSSVEIIAIGARLAETRAAINQLETNAKRLGTINQ